MIPTAIEALIAQHSSWEAALGALREDLEITEEHEDALRQSLFARIGLICWHYAKDAAEARAALEAALDLDIDDTASADVLVEIYASAGAWRERIALQLDRLDAVTAVAERAGLLADVATIYASHLREPDAALLALRKACDEAPLDAGVHLAISRLVPYFPDEASTLLETLAERVERELGARNAVDAIALAAHARAAAGRSDLAQVRYERILAIDPTHAGALDGLEAAYLADEDWESVAELLQRRAKLDISTRDEAALWLRVAQLRGERLNDASGEANALLRAWELGQTEPELVMRLATLLREGADWPRLATVLAEQADAATTPETRAETLAELAKLQAEQIGIPDTAEATWRRAWEANPRLPAALDAVEAAARAHPRYDDLVAVLATRSQLSNDPAQRATIDIERANLLATRLEKPDEAIALLEQLVAATPEHRAATDALVAHFEQRDTPRDVVRVLLGFARSTAPLNERVEALVRGASVAEKSLEDPAHALSLLTLAASESGNTPALLREMARLNELLGNNDEAVRIFDQLATTGDNSERIHTLLQMGRLQLSTQDPAAIDTFRSVLAVDPNHTEAFTTLAARFAENSQHDERAQLLAARVLVERNLPERARLLAQLGQLQLECLAQPLEARESFEAAVELDPNNLEAIAPLAQMCFEASSWERVPALLQKLLHDPRFDRTSATHATLHAQIATAAASLGREEVAIENLQAALRLDPTRTALLPTLARLLEHNGGAADAAGIWRSIAIDHVHAFPSAEHPRLRHEAALSLEKAGDNALAASLWTQVLEDDPWFAPALRVVARGGASAAPAELRLSAAKHLLQLEEDPAARLALTLEIGNQLHTSGDALGAIATYRIAIELDPASKAALHRLLNLFMETEQWRRAAEVLGRLSELETETTRVHRLLFTIAALFREQLDEPLEALRFLSRILDDDPLSVDASTTSEQILAEAGAWEELERFLRRQLDRLNARQTPEATAATIAALKQLGTLYLETLGRPDEAIAAWRIVSRIDPRDLDALEAIARTYPSGGKSDDDLIEEHRALLAVRPDRLDSWHTLFSTYKRRREYDRAWRTAAVLVVMGAAEPHETNFYEQYRPPQLAMTQLQVAAEDHSQLMHPGLDYLLTRLFAVLAQTVAPVFAQDPRVVGVNPRKDRIDMAQPDSNVARIVQYAQRVLGAPAFEVIRHPHANGIAHANFGTPTLLLGADLFASAPDRILVFRIARAVMLLRPEYYFAAVYNSPDALKTFVYAAFAVFTGQVVAAPTVEAVTACAEQIQRLPPPVLEELSRCVNGFLASGVSPDVLLWLKGAQLTAARAGLLLCGDLQRAVEGVNADPNILGRVEATDCIRDLVLYSASEAYEGLRAGLRLGIGQS